MLNYIWAFFFISAFFGALYQAFFNGNADIWQTMTETIFSSSKSAFTVSLNLTGILCFWLGMMKIAEKSGITEVLARVLYPLFRKIMPDVPEKSPALGSMVMNIAANVLGLDNAATPMGIKAMEQLQAENPNKKEASNAQILFMVINNLMMKLRLKFLHNGLLVKKKPMFFLMVLSIAKVVRLLLARKLHLPEPLIHFQKVNSMLI
jgi:spore maturation protein SpmA